ncbi:MAG: VOC family protein [Microbacterium sp.]|uniref:VOC family protein n=1 Tax=Microbacterium sp. TaxID=51671 RepID=UPI00272014A6|nr:VOC family protein [Microbacterium sp.]MDO8381857.1 VOC family protein [Microbacterium sp.]
MAIRSGFPILSTPDLVALVDFYAAAFDAERTYAFTDADGTAAYVSLSMGGVALGIAREDVPTGSSGRAALWLYVDDVDQTYARALSAGAVNRSAPTDTPWGERVAQIEDPDGLVIHIAEEA